MTITKKFKFSIGTPYINSEYTETVEFEFEDDVTDEEIQNEMDEIYTEWLFQKNTGTWKSIN